MTTQTVFTERLITDGYTLRAREIRAAVPSGTDTERTSFNAPFNITVSYVNEYFGATLPMYIVDHNDKIVMPRVFHYDSERLIEAHLYRLANGDYLAVQRYRDTHGSVHYIVELYTQNNTR